MHLDHVTIRTHKLFVLRDFMVDIFELVDGPRPATIVASVNGHWLYDKDWPLIHLIESPIPIANVDHRAEAIDHFAFVMSDYDAFKQKLIDKNITFELMDIPEMGRKRIFVRAPNDILIETIFEGQIF